MTIRYSPAPGYHICAVHARPDGKGGYRKDYTWIKTEKAARAEPEEAPAKRRRSLIQTEDMRDIEIAQKRLADLRSGKDRLISGDELAARLSGKPEQGSLL